MTDTSTLTWYDDNAPHLTPRYETALPHVLHQTLTLWTRSGMRVVDLGCGSGHDSRFMSLGIIVTTADGSTDIIVEDKLLGGATGGAPCDGRFDVVDSIAMLMHFSDKDCFLSVRNLTELFCECGMGLISLASHHPAESRHFLVLRTLQEVSMFFEDFSFTVLERETPENALERIYTWHTLELRKERKLRCDQHALQFALIENQQNATYKLALLHALCDIAQTKPTLRFLNETDIAISLGLMIVQWIACYWPLIGPPQVTGLRRMEFQATLAEFSRPFAWEYFTFRWSLKFDRLNATFGKTLQNVAPVIATTLHQEFIEHSVKTFSDVSFPRLSASKQLDTSANVSKEYINFQRY